MAALNQAKIITALEKIVTEARENFISSFLLAYGTPKATVKRLQMGDKQRNVAQIAGDVAVAQKIYFHPLQKGENPQGTLERILALPLIAQHKIRFVMVTDFKTVLAYDGKVDDHTEFDFDDFKTNYEFFLPLTGQYEKAVAYAEHPADVKACEKMGKLYDRIRAINHFENDNLHSLNIFLTRLLFCFFAEDTGIFGEQRQVTYAVKSLTKEDGSDLTEFFETLFDVLNLPDNAPERKNLSVTFQSFPYVNGGLFKEQSPIPKFDAKARRLLLDCGYMAWSDISPVIFGSMFQAVMDPEKRRSMGAHYTSERNILKIVRPLFLDALYEEFEQILTLNSGKKKAQALKDFQQKLGTLGFLDPACGCGNFLVVSYRELRELELKVLLAVKAETGKDDLWLNVSLLSKVTINQFYGIELEEFPVEIARVSMWLMEHVMNLKFGEAFGLVFPSIPLQNSAEIVYANALTTPWEEVVEPEKLNYILGNPPFGGASMLSKEQKQWVVEIFKHARLSASLDLVTAWYKRAAEYIKGTNIEVGFVSTNSICQGEQVFPLWNELFTLGCVINFAHRTFKWSNEAKGKANVYCIIVGFACFDRTQKSIYSINEKLQIEFMRHANMINPYLIEAANIIVSPASYPVSAPLKMVYGNKPTDNGNLILNEDEKEKILARYPAASIFIKRYVGAVDFLNGGKKRYCLWLKNISKYEWDYISEIQERVDAVRLFRSESSAKPTRDKAQMSEQFFFAPHTGNPYLLIPRVSSQRRKYVPIGFMDGDTVASDSNMIVQDAKKYDFGILTSTMHMAWMRAVCGRLKSDYRYSASVVYNTFPWPTPSTQQKKHIESLAEAILMTREMYPDMTLADMYDPDKMPEPLRAAHTALDIAVDGLYRKKPFASDEERLQLLFELYEKLVSKNPHAGAVSDDEEDDSDD